MITAPNKYGHNSGQGETHEKKNKGMPLCSFHHYFWYSFSMPYYDPLLG